MAGDIESTPSRARRRAPWIALGLVLMLCAWLAAHGDEDAAMDIARPLTHASTGVPPHAHSNPPGTNSMRDRRIVVSLGQALSASSARADFPALTDIGQRGWAGTAQAVVVASARPLAAEAAAPPVFPFQWVGLWTQPGHAQDGSDTQPMAIIAGPHSTWMVKQGDLLDEDWKMSSISAGQIQVIHLPTSSRQTISMSKL